MSALHWDRLLETMYRREAKDLLLVVGSCPMIRLPDQWRQLQTSRLTPGEMERLVQERFPSEPSGEADENLSVDFAYGDVGRFRATVVDWPDTRVLLVSRLS